MTFTVLPNVGTPARLPVSREMVAPFANVRLAPLASVPSVRVNVLVTLTAPASVALLPAPTLIFRLLKANAPIWGAAPMKRAVPVGVNVPPDFTQVFAPRSEEHTSELQ